MIEVAIPSGSFRVIIHTGDDSEPLDEGEFPFVPHAGLRIVDPRSNAYTPIKSVSWDADESVFLVEIDE
jgi:hypothetical protein